MGEVGLKVNNTPTISMEQHELTNKSHCSVLSKDDDTELRIPMKLDGIL